MDFFLRIFRWLGKKTVFIALIISVVVLAILAGECRKAFGDKCREATQLYKEKEEAYQNTLKSEPHRFWHPIRHGFWEKECEFRQSLRDEAFKDYQKITTGVQGFWGKVKTAFFRTFNKLLFIIILALLGPTIWKLFWYYILAAAASRAKPINLGRGGHPDCSQVTIGENSRACLAPLAPGQKLIARMDWAQQYPPTVKKRTRILWNWKAPFISCAAGLTEMTEWTTTKNDATDCLVLSSGLDPEKYIMRIDISDHPGIALNPSCIVALTESVNVKTKWNFGNIHSWISGQLRHILFYGTGTIYIYGYGGIRPVIPLESCRFSKGLVLGFEQQLEFSTVRTETFVPFYRNQTALFDSCFNGDKHVITQLACRRPNGETAKGPLEMIVEAIKTFFGLM